MSIWEDTDSYKSQGGLAKITGTFGRAYTTVDTPSLISGKIIGIHPETARVDVRTDRGTILSNCQVATYSGGTKGGFSYLMSVTNFYPTKGPQTSLDISFTDADSSVRVIVSYIEDNPDGAVIVGFIWPLTTQMLFSEQGLQIERHAESGIYQMLDAAQNYEFVLPDGSYLHWGPEGAPHRSLEYKDVHQSWHIPTASPLEYTLHHVTGTEIDIFSSGELTLHHATGTEISILPSGYVLYTPPYIVDVLSDEPEALWELNDSASGHYALDRTGHNHTGNIFGGVLGGVDGPIENITSMSFDGSTGYIGVINLSNFPTTGSYTLESWIFLQANGNNGIIGYGDFSTENYSLALRTNGAEGLLNYWWSDDLPAVGLIDLRNKWHHVAATFDGTTRILYLDGLNVAQDTPTGLNAQLEEFSLGSTNYLGGGEWFQGSLADIALYTKALSPERIMSHYMSVQDTSGLRYAAFFNGSDDYVSLPNSIFNTLAEGTISFWTQLYNIGGASYICSTTVDGSYLDLRVEGSTGEIAVQAWSPMLSYNGYAYASSPNSLLHHIAVIANGSEWSFYIDGVLSAATPLGTGNIGLFYAGLPTGTQTYTIGYNSVISTRLNGLMWDMCVYNHPLSPANITLLASGSEPNVVDDSHLVGWWPFNEGSGTIVHDMSGNGHDGTWNGTGIHWLAR